MTVFVTQSDIQLSGPGLIGSDVAGSGVRRSKRITIGAGLTLSGGVLTNTLDLSGYLPLAGGTLSGALTIPAGSAAAPSIAITGLTGGGGLCTSAPSRIDLAWGGSIKHTFWSDGSYYQNDGNAELKIANRVSLFSSASHVLEQRSGLNAQCFDLFETYTSGTNNGKLRLKATSSGHQIGSARESSGSNRALQLGHFDSAGAFTNWLSVGTNGTVAIPGEVYIGSGNVVEANALGLGIKVDGYIAWANSSNAGQTKDTRFSRSSAGVLQLGTTTNNALGSLLLLNLTASGNLNLSSLPTSDPGVSGRVWRDGSTLKISI